MPNLTDITGIGIGAIAVILFYKLAATHIHANTLAIKELAELIRTLKQIIKDKI